MPQPRKAAGSAKDQADARQDASSLESLRDLLGKGLLLSGDGMKEALDEAVRRGRMTRRDAEDLLASLVAIGVRQTQDAMAELEKVLDKGASAARRAPGTDKALANVDRARRAAGVGSAFPIDDYDSLTAAQVTERLPDLDPGQLRKVRDHERRNANRKSVLGAVERLLS